MGIPLAEPNIGPYERECILDALDSGWINTTGHYVTEFQNLMAKTIGVNRAVATANGTSGLFMALKALDIGPGDKVIVPSLTFVASVNAIMHAGAEPVFIDCDEYLNLNVIDLLNYLSTYPSDVKAIMPVHLFGNPCDMKTINRLAHAFGLYVIEDACEALGSKSNDGPCGASGEIAVLSFSFNKMITSGNGGMVLTHDNLIADKIRYWITQSKDDPINYIHNEVGYNLGMTNILAALGYAQLTRLDELLKRKREIATQYIRRLGIDRLFVTPPYAEGSNFWFIAYEANNRQKLQEALKKQEIESRPIFTPNHTQKPFADFECIGSLPNTSYYASRVINLPCSTTITETQISKVCDIIKSLE